MLKNVHMLRASSSLWNLITSMNQRNSLYPWWHSFLRTKRFVQMRSRYCCIIKGCMHLRILLRKRKLRRLLWSYWKGYLGWIFRLTTLVSIFFRKTKQLRLLQISRIEYLRRSLLIWNQLLERMAKMGIMITKWKKRITAVKAVIKIMMKSRFCNNILLI